MISAIIPARNEEASIARVVESVAAQPEVGEVIVVNDQSTDGTRQILDGLESQIPKLRVIEAGELPAGWVGKNHAVALGAAAATGDWLLFTDADTYHMLGSARRALSDAVDHDAVLVSYSPEQETNSFWERALIPFIYCRLGARFSYARVNNPALPDAAANGQYLLVLRDAYEAVGGHAAIAGEVLEDVAFAQRMKESGRRIYFTAPMGIVRTRMYRTFGAMWEGWTKNLYPLIGGRPSSVLLEMAAVLRWAAVLLVALINLQAHVFGVGRFFVVCLAIALAGAHASYALALYRNLLPVSRVKYYMVGVCLYVAALTASWWKNTRGTVAWKGRTYRVRSAACPRQGV